ncbi:MAG: cytochrome C oxidase subunit IV family protein [Bacteroidota bacterium]
MEFHDNYPQYEIMAHHSEEEGKKKRKKLWNVFWIMLVITLIELVVGIYAENWGLLTELRMSTVTLKLLFIGFTILKAYYIVYAFMHLGDENRLSKWVIIGPYMAFVLYLVYMTSVEEGTYSSKRKVLIDPIIQMQATELRTGGGHGGHGGEHGGEHKDNGGEHKKESH